MSRPPTEQALLNAIRDTPDDPVARLAYADWLEEQGRAAEAEGVRWAARGRKSPLATQASWAWADFDWIWNEVHRGLRPCQGGCWLSTHLYTRLPPSARDRAVPGRVLGFLRNWLLGPSPWDPMVRLYDSRFEAEMALYAAYAAWVADGRPGRADPS